MKDFISQKNRILVFLILLFLITRILLLLFNFDALIWHEERYNGTITLEILNGIKMLLSRYQHVPYSGGSVVMGILAVPFFRIFGSSYFSFKLLPLLMSTLTMSLWYLFLFRYFSPAIAFISSLLFIISPPNNFIYSVFGAGHHYESNLFSIAMISIFCSLFFSESNGEKKSVSNFFILGLISGFACYFVLTSFVTLIVILMFWFLFDKHFFFKKYFLIFSFSFIVGFSPYIVNSLAGHWNTLSFHGQAIYLPEQGDAFYEKFIQIATTAFPLSLGFTGIRGTLFHGYIYYLIAVAAYLSLLYKNRNSIKKVFCAFLPLRKEKMFFAKIPVESMFLLFTLLYVVLYVFSNFDVPHYAPSLNMLLNYRDTMTYFMQFRYFTPLFPFVFIFIAMFAVNLWNSKKKRKAGKIFSIIILVTAFSICGLNYLKFLRHPDIAKGLFYCGSDYTVVGKKIASANRGNIEESIRLVNKIDEQYRVVALRGIGIFYGYEKNKEYLPQFLTIAEKMDEMTKNNLYTGLSIGLAANTSFNFDKMKFQRGKTNENFKLFKIISRIDKKYRYLFREKTGHLLDQFVRLKKKKNLNDFLRILKSFRGRNILLFENYKIHYKGKPFSFWIKRINSFPSAYRSQFYKALGRGAGVYFGEDYKKLRRKMRHIPEYCRRGFFQGLAQGLSKTFSEQPEEALIFIDDVDEKYRNFFMHSFGKALFWRWAYNFEKINIFIGRFNENDKRFCYEGIGSGAGFLLYWNPSKLKEIEMKIKIPFRKYFINAARQRIENDAYLSKQSAATYFNHK